MLPTKSLNLQVTKNSTTGLSLKLQGFTMIGISVDQGAAEVQSYADKNKINYPILMADKQVQKSYGNIRAIPTTFILDRNGIVRYAYIGMPSDKKVFRRNVEELLSQ